MEQAIVHHQLSNIVAKKTTIQNVINKKFTVITSLSDGIETVVIEDNDDDNKR